MLQELVRSRSDIHTLARVVATNKHFAGFFGTLISLHSTEKLTYLAAE